MEVGSVDVDQEKAYRVSQWMLMDFLPWRMATYSLGRASLAERILAVMF